MRALRVLALRARARDRPQDRRAAAPDRRLASHFGSRLAAELQQRAAFEDSSPVSEQRKVVSESREVTFDQDIRELFRLEAILGQLVERLCAALVAQRRRG